MPTQGSRPAYRAVVVVAAFCFTLSLSDTITLCGGLQVVVDEGDQKALPFWPESSLRSVVCSLCHPSPLSASRAVSLQGTGFARVAVEYFEVSNPPYPYSPHFLVSTAPRNHQLVDKRLWQRRDVGRSSRPIPTDESRRHNTERDHVQRRHPRLCRRRYRKTGGYSGSVPGQRRRRNA